MARFHSTGVLGAGGIHAPGSPRLMHVTDRVYCATNYALSNILYVITGKSVVVIDTTESLAAAHASFDEFRKICSLPVSDIIYTHFHGDHIRGAKVFLCSVDSGDRPEEVARRVGKRKSNAAL